MATWNLYRHRNSDGSSKDWAVRSNPDSSITTRWGKTASCLPGVSNRRGVRQVDIERQKQAKGYVFVGEVEIDGDGNVVFPGKTLPATQSLKSDPEPVPTPMVKALYWTIDCQANQFIRVALGSEVRRLIGAIQTLTEHRSKPEQDWNGWQQ
jgi:hypothetical protein